MQREPRVCDPPRLTLKLASPCTISLSVLSLSMDFSLALIFSLLSLSLILFLSLDFLLSITFPLTCLRVGYLNFGDRGFHYIF